MRIDRIRFKHDIYLGDNMYKAAFEDGKNNIKIYANWTEHYVVLHRTDKAGAFIVPSASIEAAWVEDKELVIPKAGPGRGHKAA